MGAAGQHIGVAVARLKLRVSYARTFGAIESRYALIAPIG
jgi:hypothetical protein